MYYTMQGNDVLYAGIGLWQSSSNKQAPAVVALNPSNGDILWTKVLGMAFVAEWKYSVSQKNACYWEV